MTDGSESILFSKNDIQLFLEAREDAGGNLSVDEFLRAKIEFSKDQSDMSETDRLQRVVEQLGTLGVAEKPQNPQLSSLPRSNVRQLFGNE